MSASVNFCRSASPRLEVIGEPREHVGQPPGFGADGDEPAIEIGKRPRPARERAGERLAGGDLRAQRGERASPRARRRPARRRRTSAWSSGMPERVSVASRRVTSESDAGGKPRALDRAARRALFAASIAVGNRPSPRSWSRTWRDGLRVDQPAPRLARASTAS